MAVKRKPLSLERKMRRSGYLFMLPFAVGSVFFLIYPIILSLVFSFSDVIPTVSGYTTEFVGIKNYLYLFNEDPHFKRTLVETLRDMILNVPVVLIFSFFIASVLNQKFWGRTFARAVLFLPMIVSSGAVMQLISRDVVTGNMADKGSQSTVDFSAAFVSFLQQLKVGDTITNLLVSAINNIGTVLAMSAIPIIIFLAGLQSISPSIYEASYVEGATKWEVFWKISLPMISPLVLVVILYCVIDMFTSADNNIMLSVRETCFDQVLFGRGSAMAWIYLAVVIVLLTVTYLIVNRMVFYYD